MSLSPSVKFLYLISPSCSPPVRLGPAASSSFWLQDASYVRLKNITLGYNVPQAITKKLGIDRVKVYLSGENLLTFDHLDGIDPESPSDTRGNFYSNIKKVTLGLKVTF